MVRKPEFPLPQIIRRLSEKEDVKVDQISYPKLSKSHHNGPVPDIIIDGHQFKKNKYMNIYFKKKFKDSCVRIQGKFSHVKKHCNVFRG